MTEYKLKPGRVGKAVMSAYKRVENAFVDTFLEKRAESEGVASLKCGRIGEAVAGTYQKIEDAVVGGYQKIENRFVDTFLEKTQQPEPAGSEPPPEHDLPI